LNNPERGVRFPTTLRFLPLLEGREGTVSYQDWKDSSNPQPGRPTSADIEAILTAADPERCQQVADDANEALNELYALSTVLDEKMGSAAPTLLEVRTALEQCVGVAQDFAAGGGRKQPRLEDTTGEGAAGPGETGRVGHSPAGPRCTPSYVGRRRDAALEPRPVPYLIDRAVELGDMPFHLMIRQLVRDANALAEINRDLGIRDGGADAGGRVLTTREDTRIPSAGGVENDRSGWHPTGAAHVPWEISHAERKSAAQARPGTPAAGSDHL
jgi:type VI secretion system protein ImpA